LSGEFKFINLDTNFEKNRIQEAFGGSICIIVLANDRRESSIVGGLHQFVSPGDAKEPPNLRNSFAIVLGLEILSGQTIAFKNEDCIASE